MLFGFSREGRDRTPINARDNLQRPGKRAAGAAIATTDFREG
jgi:hypothetical protein